MPAPNTPRLPASERLRRAGVGAWSIIGILILVAIFVWILDKIHVIFPPLVLALLIIYLINPSVGRLQGRGVPRALSVAIAYLGIIALFVGLGMVALPRIAEQVESFGEQAPAFKAELATFVDRSAESVERRFNIEINTSQVECLLEADEIETRSLPDAPSDARCDQVTEDLRERIAEQAGRLTTIASGVLEVLLIFVLGPLLALYLLIDLPVLQRDVLRLVS